MCSRRECSKKFGKKKAMARSSQESVAPSLSSANATVDSSSSKASEWRQLQKRGLPLLEYRFKTSTILTGSTLLVIKHICESLETECDTLITSKFRIHEFPDKEWEVKLCKTFSSEILANISLVENVGNDAVDARIKWSAIDTEFCEVNLKTIYYTYSEIGKSCNISLGKITKGNENILHSGNLVLHLEIAVLGMSPSINDDSSTLKNTIMSESLTTLLKEAHFSDFIVQVKDKLIPCHKSILSCRSEVFAAMLSHNMSETNENRLVITDMEPEIFQQLLLYIYSGEVDDNISVAEACQLFSAGHKYGIERLKNICEDRLHSLLCLPNAMTLFIFASAYGLVTLKLNAYLIIVTFIGPMELDVLENQANDQGDILQSNAINQAPNLQGMPKEMGLLHSDPNPGCDKSVHSTTPENPCSCFSTSEAMKLRNASKYLPRAELWFCTDCCLSDKIIITIEDFPEILAHNRSRRACISTFVLNSYETTWQVDAYLSYIQVLDDYGATRFTLALKLLSNKTDNVYTCYKFSILGKDGEETELVNGSCTCSFGKPYEVSVENFHSRTQAIWNSAKKLTLCCCLMTRSFNLYECAYPIIQKNDLAENMSTLLKDEAFADVRIKLDHETVCGCHKAILACQSPYFLSIFKQMGSSGELVQIDEFHADLFKKALKSIYTGSCEVTDTDALELLPLAEMYGLRNLKLSCEDALISSLSAENAATRLIVADSYKATRLQNSVLKFIGEHFVDVMVTSGWSDIVVKESLLFRCFRTLLTKSQMRDV